MTSILNKKKNIGHIGEWKFLSGAAARTGRYK